MTANIKRLLAPRTIALVGGNWADAVASASRTIGYSGALWRVHPKRPSTAETPYYRSIEDLPGPPDATFVAAPNTEVPLIAASLVRRDAGGFVCFAAGFSETATDQGNQLTRDLVVGAGDLPFFGPNCYGFVNFFDGAALWPDQVIGQRRERGVALICQSGTIALNLLFNDRSLPIGYVLTVGNQTRLAVEDMIELLAEDERVTAFGLYVEGIKNPARFARAVEQARAAGKAIAMVKAGRTEAAARTARSHTGSLAGADVVFDAFCRQAGIARCDSLATLCETLKILHVGGPLHGRRALILGASGGDMAMTADAARDLGVDFSPIPDVSVTKLREILTDKVHIANPFDFHTHIWFDRPALRAMFSVVQRAGFDAVGFMLDSPPAAKADPTSYVAAIEEFIAAYTSAHSSPDNAGRPHAAGHPSTADHPDAPSPPDATGRPEVTRHSNTAGRPDAPSRAAVISSLPESMAPEIREMCLAAGIVPLQGQRQALEALDLAAGIGEAWSGGTHVALNLPRRTSTSARTLSEHEGKAALAAFGVKTPHSRVISAKDAPSAARAIGFPVVMKAASAALEHKSDVGGVIVNIRTHAEAEAAAERLATLTGHILVEEMISDGVAEILVGMTSDPQFGQVLVLGAGGVLTELLRDTASLLPPFTAPAIEAALRKLAVGKLLTGYRGRPPADIAALVDTALACTRYAAANVDTLLELDINPVIVRPAGRGAVAVDALIRLS